MAGISGAVRELLTHVVGAQQTPELCRRHGISPQTLYRWKGKYGGMSVSDAQRLKQLEDENRRLKRLVADLWLDNAALKDVTSRNW